MKRKSVLSIIALLLLVVVAIAARPKADDLVRMTVHEWGTFTSVAGENGQAMSWRSYSSPADLPCFVERSGAFKGGLFGKVRMETPVLYFYSPRAATADVKVGFPKGTLTEWYPTATLSKSYDAIEWTGVKVAPDATPVLPAGGRSHYYAARETDAAPLKVGSEDEKFLFYRGVGNFPLPISAMATADGKVLVKNLGQDAVGGLILFENRGGKPRYQFGGSLQDEITLDSRTLQNNEAGLFSDLERILVEQGLYPREAHAMVETWRDSWFEEGTRLFYIVPRQAIDAILPLEIEPAPSQIERVFVGRMEILTQAIQDDVKQAIANNDRRTLEKYGRFLEPISQRIGAKSPLLNDVYSKFLAETANCSR